MIFRKTGNLYPRKSRFRLNKNLKFTCDMGELIPVYSRYVFPGDVFRIGTEVVVRSQPLVTPVLHEVRVTTHFFKIPLRLLWKDWEKFISGGKDGNFRALPPKWNPTSDDLRLFSLWDYFGYPVVNYTVPPVDSRNLPNDFKRRCYNFIIDEYFGDQNHDDPINTDDDGDRATPPTVWGDNRSVFRRRWAKDYFSAALSFRQRGNPVALPISGTTSANFLGSINSTSSPAAPITFSPSDSTVVVGTGQADIYRSWLNNNVVDFGDASTFDVADVRRVFQLTKWMERNARAGVRYTEFLKSHFGVSPSDERLNRPEYIGGSGSTIMIDEVLQTSESSTSPQGNMSGHGLSATDGYVGKYRVQEHGIIMGIMSIMPTPSYEDGFPREDMFNDKEEVYTPEYAHLSEQAIFNYEVYPQGGNPVDADGNPVIGGDLDIWGYIPIFDELRVDNDRVVAEMRSKVPSGFTSLAYWHLSRSFSSLPHLNSEFLECNPDKRIFLVPGTKGFIVNHATLVDAIRPMPVLADPGLVDHF